MKRITRFLENATIAVAAVWLVLVLALCVAVAIFISDFVTVLILVGAIFFLGGGSDAIGIIIFRKKTKLNDEINK